MHSNINNYGIGEDINHILMHMMMQFISIRNLSTKSKKNNIVNYDFSYRLCRLHWFSFN